MRAIRNGAGALLLAAMMGAVAGAASAEDGRTDARTVASAQEFLRQVLPGNRYVSTVMTEMTAKAAREGMRGSFDPLPVIVDSDPVAHCRSYLLAGIADTWLSVRDPATGDVSEAGLAALAGDDYVGNPEGFHFGSIRALRQDGSRVHLRFAGEQHDAVLHLEGAEMAGRVHAALDFLRSNCDASAATGF